MSANGATRWRALVRLIEGSRRNVAASVAISLVQAALLVPIAFLVREAFNHAIPDKDSEQILLLGGGVLLLFIASAGLGVLNRWYSLRATRQAMRNLVARLLRKLFELPTSFYDRTELGAIHSSLVLDTERLDNMVNAVISTLVPAVVIGLALTVTLIVIDPILALLLFCSVPLLVLAGRRLSPRVRRLTREWQRESDAFNSDMNVALRSITLTRMHGAHEAEVERRLPKLERLTDATFRMKALQTVYSVQQQLISAIVGVAVLVVGGLAVSDGRLSLGGLISFYAVLALLRNQVLTSSMSMPQVISGMESLGRLEELLDEAEPQPYSGERAIDFGGAVKLERVTFSYQPGRRVLRDVTLRVEPGESVAIVGPNGAGKSTVINLIAGLYRPDSGTVFADGVPLDELDLTRLRRRIGVVVQDPFILPTTVSENIAFGRPDATDEEIEGAAAQAGADKFIRELPQVYESRVGDEGVLLSGGQRQRIATARALLGAPVLLMLDEPTTHLDRDGTAELVARLISGPRACAVLVVSHDPAVAENVDRIYSLREGRVEGASLDRRPPTSPYAQ